MVKELICIVCPRGCHLTVDTELEKVTGNTCKRGEIYGLNEVKNPTRIVTSTVKIDGCDNIVVPVKTEEPIPKRMIFDVMKEINKASVKLPIKVGDVIIEDVLGTGVSIVSAKTVS
ncbi:DUF1667 domain-containing protein [Clostridium perfringens]|uniref:DUF1667 domain-containing protein n=1 Tax=Clostridium perfringens TaxID=1502 RepID=UPI000D71C59D|nr:DUF1667 domain-containing protein [Clostridium perfringens]EGT4140044.1 DUF1667 domain-containing protein [Clostridium perfringens]MBO3429968.1 DUF1667 domain-containing protein [Clostridium perfringens]MDK0773138.1 DUF1667 domain-containing protein [Clostridium perfringens]MDK0778330.1 DUF1667 domain-containing protein [Clostridium perfringens]MDK0802598.1 DUF1667 domain-containing protein [Clostridium perfringens]